MKYMLLIYRAEDCWTDDERAECMYESMSICNELAEQGKLLAISPLCSVTTASCVRVRNGQRQVTDGPFVETTQQLGGYYIVDVDSLDEAVDIASQLPPATKGTVEVRPLLPVPDPLPFPDLPAEDPIAISGSKKYILLMYAEEGVWPPEEHALALAESVEICHDLHRQGQFVAAAPLQPPATAICVRVKNSKRITVDGPFLETKEQLGGYFLIDVANIDEAISIASRIPGARRGTAEIRPLFPLSQRSHLEKEGTDSVDSEPA